MKAECGGHNGGCERVEILENTENTENTENIENIENIENTEAMEITESTENSQTPSRMKIMRLREGRIKYLIIFLVSIANGLMCYFYYVDKWVIDNWAYWLLAPILLIALLGKDFYDRVGMFLISFFTTVIVVPFIIIFIIAFGDMSFID